jgi:ribosomal protein L40E
MRRAVTYVNNTFQKYCAHCAASNPKDAIRCKCGHSFEPVRAQTQEALADEKVYEDYLAARLKQASQTLMEAETMHKADVKDQGKAAKVANALEAAAAIRKELTAQSAKIAEFTKSLQTEAGRARLAKEAETAVQKASARRVKTCPRCKIAVPVDITRCKCDYIFREEQLGMPSLTSGTVNPTIPGRPKRN